MHATDLLHSAIPPSEREVLPCAAVIGTCCVTGADGIECIPRSHLLSKSFCDQDMLRAPDSALVGVPAWTALKYRWERMSSWLCNGEYFVRLDRQGVRNAVIAGVYSPHWAGYATTSYKKHGALRAPVNAAGKQAWLFETRVVDCTDRDKVAGWWGTLNTWLRRGVGRQSMEALDMPPAIVKKVGPMAWEEYRGWAADKWQSPLYQFLCYLLPSQDELKAEAAA